MFGRECDGSFAETGEGSSATIAAMKHATRTVDLRFMLVGFLEGGKCRTGNTGDEAGRLGFRLSSTFRHAIDGLGLVVLVEVRTLVDALSRWTGGKPRGAGTPARALILTRRERPHAPATHEVTWRSVGMGSVGVFLQSASCQITDRRRWWRKSVPPPARIHRPATRLGTAPFWRSNHESVRGAQSHFSRSRFL